MAYLPLPLSKNVVLSASVYLVSYTKHLSYLILVISLLLRYREKLQLVLTSTFFPRWYVTYGHELIWKNREPLVKAWHEMRTKNTGKGGGGRSN